MVCTLFSFFAHRIPRPFSRWPSPAVVLWQSPQAIYSLLSHGPSLTATLLKDDGSLRHLMGPPVVGSQITSQWDICGPDLKGGSQELIPHSGRGMSLPGDSGQGRHFGSWGFCCCFPYHLPAMLGRFQGLCLPKGIPGFVPFSLRWLTVVILTERALISSQL